MFRDVNGLRAATWEDGGSIVPLLARAFADDPAVRWMIREDARHDEGMTAWFRATFEHLTMPHDLSFVTDGELRGAALWVPPGEGGVSWWKQVLLAPEMLRAFGWKKLKRSLDSVNMVLDLHPTEPHYYLSTLAVEPAHQGRGLGKALMAPMLARCDAEQVPAYLECIDRNVPLYRSRGFEVKRTAPLVGGGPMMNFMWRAPVPPDALRLSNGDAFVELAPLPEDAADLHVTVTIRGARTDVWISAQRWHAFAQDLSALEAGAAVVAGVQSHLEEELRLVVKKDGADFSVEGHVGTREWNESSRTELPRFTFPPAQLAGFARRARDVSAELAKPG